MKPLIIGQAPARGNEGKLPFAGASGRRLARLAGVGDDGDVLRHHFDLHNLLDYYPGKSGKGDFFESFVAKHNFEQSLLPKIMSRAPSYILMMGHKVTICAGFKGMSFLDNRKRGDHVWICFPHPSGINRWWNDLHNEQRARRMIQEVLKRGR